MAETAAQRQNRLLRERAAKGKKPGPPSETFRGGIKIPPKKAGRPKFGEKGHKGETPAQYRARLRAWEKAEGQKKGLKKKKAE